MCPRNASALASADQRRGRDIGRNIMALDLTRVDTASRAAAMLAGDPTARFLAGGTLLVHEAGSGAGEIHRFVLSDGLGLDRIERNAGKVTIGAAVTMARIAADPALAFLKPVADSIGGPAIRNMATVGGNLFAPAPYGDFAVALLALGTTVTVETSTGEKSVDLEAFLKARSGHRTQVVRSVTFGQPPDGAFRFRKVIRKHPHGAAVLAIAAVLPVTGGRLVGVRVAYGAMAPTAIRADAVEKALEGKTLDAAAIDAAVKIAAEGTKPATDTQATDWYRRQVLPVHLRRLLAG
jgi:CO/xanthine dehydrogenase FAD-binding subunit